MVVQRLGYLDILGVVMVINPDLLLIQVKNVMRLGDGGTEVGVFSYIRGIGFYHFFFLSQFWPNLDQNYLNIKLKIRLT
jgi:hypothetical protein